MKGSEIVFDYAHILYYKCHEINMNCGVSYIDSPDLVKNKKNTTINHISEKDNKCFQCDETFALNHEEIKIDPQRIKHCK